MLTAFDLTKSIFTYIVSTPILCFAVKTLAEVINVLEKRYFPKED